MKRWTTNAALDALYKPLALLIIAHIIFFILGLYYGEMVSILGITMLWPHLETSIWGWLGGMAGALIIYGLFYAYDLTHGIEDNH
ncbi:MAG: hypothetical protein PHP50_13805 [Lachnospiraceae bacterium]|nr:hypothetical protein [Lachnospiraceae bacterium]